MERARKTFRDLWGFAQLYPHQERAIWAALNNRDVLSVVSTGGGKSTVFQLPAIIGSGTTIVFSPLISLMKDQCHDLDRKGVSATYINSLLDQSEQEERLRGMSEGEYDLVYIAPERIRTKAFWKAIDGLKIDYIAIDEVHSCSMDGVTFRPSYLRIHDLLDAFEDRPPVIGVTATATYTVAMDAVHAFDMSEDREEIFSDPIRENMTYSVERASGEDEAQDILIEIAEQDFDLTRGQYIVYVGTQRAAEAVAETLENSLGEEVSFYHGGMMTDDRHDVQERFKSGKTKIVASTNAFGMGIDVRSIRGIVHLGIPGSLEEFVQQSGRAGRDGRDSFSVVIEEPSVKRLRDFFFAQANPPRAVYELLWDYLHNDLDIDADDPSVKIRAAEIASDIHDKAQGSRSAPGKVSVNQIEAAMNALEAFGAISTQYGRSFDLYQENRRELDTARTEATNPMHAKVVEELRKQARKGRRDLLVVDVGKLARELHIPAATVADTMRWLHRKKVLRYKKTDVPMIVTVDKYGQPIEDAIDATKIEDKYITDSRRLKAMNDYINLQSQEERIAHIRKYFEM